MLIISHRGNLNGSDPSHENDPEQIKKVLNLKFDVEIDVWFENNNFFLGHDFPLYKIEESFLMNEKLWCHAKNDLALVKMLENEKIHCFWHQTDSFALTNKNIIWCYPGFSINSNYPQILVLPEANESLMINDNVLGVCTDFPILYKQILN